MNQKLLRQVTLEEVVLASWPQLLMLKLRKSPFELHVSGDVITRVATEKGWFTYSMKVQVMHNTVVDFVHRAERIVVPSNFVKTIVEGYGANPSKIFVLYPKVTIPEVPFKKGAARTELNLVGKVLVSAGTLAPWNGYGKLLGAMPELAVRFPTLRFVIIGVGMDQKKIQDTINSFWFSSRVRLVFSDDQVLVSRYLESADLFVLSSTDHGLSFGLLKAMSYALAIVTTNSGGNKEIFVDGVNAYLVPPDDQRALIKAVETILMHEDTAAQMGEKARLDVIDLMKKNELDTNPFRRDNVA